MQITSISFFSPQCFWKTFCPGLLKFVSVWLKVNYHTMPVINNPETDFENIVWFQIFTKQSLALKPRKSVFHNIVGKKRNSGN